MYFQPDGDLSEPIKPAYKRFWDATADVVQWFTSDGFDQPNFNRAKALSLAVDAIGINYRFGMAEQNILRLIDGENYLSILALTIDLPLANAVAEAESKKKSVTTEGPTSCTPGEPDCSTTTAPAVATSGS